MMSWAVCLMDVPSRKKIDEIRLVELQRFRNCPHTFTHDTTLHLYLHLLMPTAAWRLRDFTCMQISVEVVLSHGIFS